MTHITEQEILEALAAPMEYRWRESRINGSGAYMVAYITSRQVQQRLDDVLGLHWSTKFVHAPDGNVFCTISVQLPDGRIVERQDIGTESNTEKEKGEVSDAFKRAAVMFGVGRFLYNMKELRLPVARYEPKDTTQKASFKIATVQGDPKTILFDREDINMFATAVLDHGAIDGAKFFRDYKKQQSQPQQPVPQKAKDASLAVPAATPKPPEPHDVVIAKYAHVTGVAADKVRTAFEYFSTGKSKTKPSTTDQMAKGVLALTKLLTVYDINHQLEQRKDEALTKTVLGELGVESLDFALSPKNPFLKKELSDLRKQLETVEGVK